jgi:hypothetical protein
MIRVVHPGSRIPDPDADFLPSRIPDPGVKKTPNPGSRIRIRNTAFLTIRTYPAYRQTCPKAHITVHTNLVHTYPDLHKRISSISTQKIVPRLLEI